MDIIENNTGLEALMMKPVHWKKRGEVGINPTSLSF